MYFSVLSKKQRVKLWNPHDLLHFLDPIIIIGDKLMVDAKIRILNYHYHRNHAEAVRISEFDMLFFSHWWCFRAAICLCWASLVLSDNISARATVSGGSNTIPTKHIIERSLFQTGVTALTWAKITPNLDSVDTDRAAIAERGEGERGNILFTSEPNIRTQFAQFSETSIFV